MIDALAYLNPDPESRPTAVIRQVPGDFQVTEIPLVTPSGSGEHLWLEVAKTGLNTQDVAARLARVLKIPVRSVSFAGMKDRRAKTIQWFSAWMPGKPDPEDLHLAEGVQVLQMTRHQKKLQRGHLRGNHFELLIRDCSHLGTGLQNALRELGQTGVPNYFGEQRFGRNFANLPRSLEFFSGTYKPHSRHERGLLISSARAYLFNHYVDQRLQDQLWDVVLDGDVLNLAGSQSVFVADFADAALQTRYQDRDIHITGPLYGGGESMADGAALKMELQLARQHREYFSGLEGVNAKYARRAMRVIPWDIEFSVPDEKTLRLAFSLPAGAYATSVLREFFDYSVAIPEGAT